MKLITAVVKPFTVNDIREELATLGLFGMTVTEVTGYGQQKGHTEVYRGANYDVEFVTKAKVEILVADNNQERVVAAVVKAARTGKIGDGKVWVTHVEELIRVRTGESGEQAV